MPTASLVPSPCRNICQLKRGICIGCGRTGEEIAAWPTASDPVRLQIRARADARLSAAGPRR
ncbi:DUF1289 domain-containing protein [Thermaurantiacus sp.]